MIKDLWPQVPLLTHPRPGTTGLVELNQPDEKAIVLITGNNKFTQDVLLTVLGTTLCPFYVVFTDTDGNTIDMAMIFRTFTAERIFNAIQTSGISKKIKTNEMIIPGLASSLLDDIIKITGYKVIVGPECAAELPLFLSEIWTPPEEISS